MRAFIVCIVLAGLCSAAHMRVAAQTHPTLATTPLKAGGVMSRNMELVDVLAFNTQNGDQFETVSVPYTISGVTKHKVLIVSSHRSTTAEGHTETNCLRLVDVTNPRASNSDYLRFYIKNAPIEPAEGLWHNFGMSQVYKDTRTAESGTFKGDVFIIAWVGDKTSANVEGGLLLNFASSGLDTKARFVIINLSQAVLLKETSSPSTNGVIDIPNAYYRNVDLNGTSVSNRNIYIGYIPSDYDYLVTSGAGTETAGQDDPHALNIDQNAGIMTLSPHRTVSPSVSPIANRCFIDVFAVKNISTTIYPTTSSTAVPTVFDRLTADEVIGGVTYHLPIPTPTFMDGSTLRYALRRDIAIEELSSTKVRLSVASPTGGHVSDGLAVGGGIVISELDYSTPNQCTLGNTKWWKYDADRDSPGRRLSQDGSLDDLWSLRLCHSAYPMKLKNVSQPIILTTDEFASPHTNPLETSGDWPVSISTTGSPSDSRYIGSDWRIYLNPGSSTGKYQDDRRVGSFLRAWKTQTTSGVLEVISKGSGTDDGPVGLFDAIESVDADDLYYSSYRTIPSSTMKIDAQAVANPGTGTSVNQLGPSCSHRPHVITDGDEGRYEANGDDVVLSAYAQGVRVIGMEDVVSSPYVVNEKAFFDFIPRLSYREWDPYFYLLCKGGASEYSKWNSNAYSIGNYFLGVWHSYSDFGTERCSFEGLLDVNATPPVRLPSDEKFVYSMGYGEGKFESSVNITSPATEIVPQDPSDVLAESGRNWLPEGGFLVLRYFDGKLGGTLKGYEGTGSTPRKWSRRPYQTINLQGDFTVERDVTVAAGACVQLLPGHESDPGIFASTSLAPPSSGSKTVYVDGVLNISIPEGDAIGTDIVIDVPIVVRDGGVLNIYNIRSGKKVMFKKKVIVQSGGTWKFHKSSNVELYYEDHEANGKLIVDGDEDARVKITSRRNGTSYSKSAYIVGRGTTDNAKSLVSIEYADITNTYIDLDRITVNSSTFTITQSDFRTTRNAERGGLFLFKLTRPLSEYVSWGTFRRRQAKVRITNTDFTDALSGLPALQSIQFAAMVSDAASLYLTNVGLDKFLVGLFAKDNDGVYITDCQVTNSTMGVVAENGSSVICNTDFYNNEFSSTKYGTGSGQYKDNNYSVMKGGANIQNSGVQYFRNNEFSAYCYGVQSWGTTLFMRNEVRPGNDIEYGRNDFLVNTDQYGVWGCPTTDIGMARAAQLIVNCGYNQFSGASAYHVTGDNTCPAVDVSYNQWNPGAGYDPRFYNINWNGDNRNVQQDREPDCGIVVNNLVVCNAPGLPPRGGEGYSELGFNDASLYTAASSVRTEVQDAGIGWRNRRDKAWEYFEVVSKIDSSTYQEVLKSDMQTILANSSLDSTLRSAALFIKASVHSARGEYDSAKTALATLRSTYPLKSDSVPANWETMYINAITDTTGKVDSLIGVYLDRVLTDLRRKTTYGSTGLSKANIDRGESIAGSGLVVSMNGPTHPNPSTTGRAVMTITSNKSTKCFVDVVNVQGTITDSFEYSLGAGVNRVEINTEKYAPGTYTAQIRCDDSVNRVSFVVTR